MWWPLYPNIVMISRVLHIPGFKMLCASKWLWLQPLPIFWVLWMKWLVVLNRKKKWKGKNGRKLTREKTLGSDSLKIEKMKQDRVSELEKWENEKEMPRLVFKVMFRGSRCTLGTRTPSLSVLLCDGFRGTYRQLPFWASKYWTWC